MFGRSYVRILSGTQIFSLSHAPDMLIISFSQRRLMFRQWSLPKYFASKAKWVLRRYYIFLAAGNKKSQRANATTVRVWCKWIHTTIGSRKDEHGIHKHAHGSIVYHVFARKQWILCSALCHKSCFTLYLMLNRFEIHSTLEISRKALLGCLLALRVLARLRGRWQKL